MQSDRDTGARVTRAAAAEEAWRAWTAGEGTFAAVHRALSPALTAVAARYVDRGTVPDIVQMAFLRLVQHRHSYDGRGALLYWARRIAQNEAMQYLRRTRRQSRLCRDVEREPPPAAPRSPEEALLATERDARLHAALGRLPEPTVELLEARYFQDRTPLEIAGGQPGRHHDTLRVRLHRAVRKLRGELSRSAVDLVPT